METTADKNCQRLEFATRSSVITIRGPGLWFDGDERPGQGHGQDQDQDQNQDQDQDQDQTRPGPSRGEKRRREGKRGKKARGERQMNPSGFERMVG